MSQRGSGGAAGELGRLLSGWGPGVGLRPFLVLIHSLLPTASHRVCWGVLDSGGSGDSSINSHGIEALGKAALVLKNIGVMAPNLGVGPGHSE